MDDILGPDPNEPVYEAMGPHRNIGFDREGRPIYIERTGQMRVHELLKYVSVTITFFTLPAIEVVVPPSCRRCYSCFFCLSVCLFCFFAVVVVAVVVVGVVLQF